jgi:DNA-binding CsgD family transcriptional regulator
MRGQKQKYPVELSEAEVEQLTQVVKRGKYRRREIQRAQMLLWSAEGKTDVEIASLMSVNPLTVATTRERWATEKRIADAPKPGRHKKLNGKQEAFVVALACSDAPAGRESWTLQLLADKLVELKVIDEPVSYETVRATLKKTNLSLGRKSSGASRQ